MSANTDQKEAQIRSKSENAKKLILRACEGKFKTDAEQNVPRIVLKPDTTAIALADQIKHDVKSTLEFDSHTRQRPHRLSNLQIKRTVIKVDRGLKKLLKAIKEPAAREHLSFAWMHISGGLFSGIATLSRANILRNIEAEEFFGMAETEHIGLLLETLQKETQRLLRKIRENKRHPGSQTDETLNVLTSKIVRSISGHSKMKLSSAIRSDLHNLTMGLIEIMGFGWEDATVKNYLKRVITNNYKRTN